MSTRHHIVLVSHYYPDYGGGIEKVAYDLTRYLTQQGNYEFHWFASDHTAAVSFQEHLNCHPMPSWRGLKRLGLDWPIWKFTGLKQLKHAIQETDLVHIHEYSYCGSIAAWWWAKRYHKPIVITQHLGDTGFSNPILNTLLRLINRTLGRMILAHAQAVIFISYTAQVYFSRFTPLPVHNHYWPNGTDISIFYPLLDNLRQEQRQHLAATERPIILFVGRFIDKKGLSFLKQLASHMQAIDWWFAGNGDVTSSSHPNNWQLPNVRVFEGRSHTSLAALYQAADLLILPSQGEGFPLVVQEAMACGTTALISEQTAQAAPEAQQHILTCPIGQSPQIMQQWQRTIEQFLQRDNLSSHRQTIAAFAKEHWSQKQYTQQYADLFNKLLRH